MNGLKKKAIALVLAVCTLLSMGVTVIYAEVGWFGPNGKNGFTAVDSTIEMAWDADLADKIDLFDYDLSDWDTAGVSATSLGVDNLVAWYGSIPEDWAADLYFAVDADNLYVAARITDDDVVENDTAVQPVAPTNIVNYNTGDNIQFALDFGNMIAQTLENDDDRAMAMDNDKAIFYSVGYLGHGRDVCISVQENGDSHMLGAGDGEFRFWGEDSGVKGKTFATLDGWATEFCIPLEELFLDACYKTFYDTYSGIIGQSMVVDASHPLEIGMSVYQMNWSHANGTKEMSGAYGLHDGAVNGTGNPVMTWGAEELPTKLSLAYEDGMDFTSVLLLTPGEEPLEADPMDDYGVGSGNAAYASYISISNGNTFESYEVDGWGLAALNDLDTDTGWHSNIFGNEGSTWQKPTILTFDLGAIYELGSVWLHPYTGDAYEASVMPRTYSIEVFSVEECAWVEVAYDEDVVAANGVYTDDFRRVSEIPYFFEPVYANRVRIVIYEDSNTKINYSDTCYCSCIGEIQIMTADYEYDGDYDGDYEWTEPEFDEKDGLKNLASGKKVTVNNGNTYEEEILEWGLAYLTDGSIYSAWVNGEEIVSSSSSPTVLTLNLSKTYEVSSIEIYPYAMDYGDSTMPRAYTVEVYSTVDKEWIEVGRERNAYVDSGTEDITYFTYTFDPMNASRVRITITKDSAFGEGAINYTCIGEIAVWGGPARTVSNNEGGSDNKETKPETEAETVVETVAESESETAIREQETTAKNPPAAVAVVGCASSVGFGALTILAIASAAVVIKRRKEE